LTKVLDWKEFVKEVTSKTEKIRDREPDDHKKLRLGLVEAGAYGQYFSTWETAYSMLRDFTWYTLVPILKLAGDPSFDLDRIKTLLKAFVPRYAEFLSYCGLTGAGEQSGKMIEALETVQSLDDCRHLLNALLAYLNQVTFWAYHYFPWGVGVLFPQRKLEDAHELYELAQR
jgi:hypothetical protein